MLDDLFLNDNLRTLQDAAMRPPPVPKQAAGFSAWRTATALPRGVVAGGVQAGSGMADVLGAFGETLGATGTASSRGMFSVPTAEERQQADAAAKKLREQGASFDLGDPGRRFADEFKPDPETAHTAERLVFDFARVASKAVGYVATTGGLPGALMTGADEGLTVADELKQQGVDLATRTKVGAVVGGVTALGVGLPMAGNTLAQTAGLVALGGPVSFMAQQQAVRSILEAADYSKLAEQYDPLDPVGLAVSTLIPVGFGAWGLRAAKARQAKDAAAAEARAAAEFAAGPVPSERTAVANAVRAVTDEQVDAARVMLAVERRQAGNPGRADDLGAQQAHETALARAEEQMARGERVAVDDVAPRFTPEQRAANFDAWFGGSKVVDAEGKPLVVYHGTNKDFSEFSKDGVKPLGFPDKQGFYFTSDPSYAGDYGAALMPVYLSIRNPYRAPRDGYEHTYISPSRRAELEAMGHDGVVFEGNENQPPEIVAFRPEQIKSATGNSGRFDPNSTSLTDSPIADWTANVNAAIRELRAAAKELEPNAATPARATPEATPPAAEAPPTDARGPGPEQQPARPDAATGGTASAEARLVDDATARQADPFATTRLVLPEAADVADQLRGMGEGAFWAVEGGRLLRSGTDTPGDGGMGGEVVGRTSWVPADEWFGRMRNDMGASGLSNQKEIKAAIEKAIEGQPLNAKERRTIDWMRGEIRDMEAKLWELDDADQAAVDAFGHGLSSRDAGDFALTARAAEIDADAVERAAIRFENDDAGFMAEMRRIADGQDRQAAGTADQPGAGPGARGDATADPPATDARGTGPEQQPTRPDAATGGAATAEARLVDDATARQADALLAEQPDMLVMLDGMDAPRRLSEVLADIKAEADEMRLDGELLQVAAQCALQNGA